MRPRFFFASTPRWHAVPEHGVLHSHKNNDESEGLGRPTPRKSRHDSTQVMQYGDCTCTWAMQRKASRAPPDLAAEMPCKRFHGDTSKGLRRIQLMQEGKRADPKSKTQENQLRVTQAASAGKVFESTPAIRSSHEAVLTHAPGFIV